MNQCKVFIPIGALGGGIDETTFQQGLAKKPDIISLDAGSTDSGPYYLGTGKMKYAKEAVAHDLRLVLLAARDLKIPVTIGSAGTCGTDGAVNQLWEICQEIYAKEKFELPTTRIYTEIPAELAAKRYQAGAIRPLHGAPAINEDTFATCTHIVALSGIEPFIEALSQGAQVVLCGRATDTAVIAAYPIMHGFDKALCWHAAKIAECGALCTDKPTEGGVLLTFDEQGVVVEATAEGNSCSVYSVSSHLLYENSNPIRLTEPGCVIDTTKTEYILLDGGAVRVRNTVYESRPYTMKLEGSGPVGYQTVTLAGIKDPKITRDPGPWLKMLTNYVDGKLNELDFEKGSYAYELRPYGWNAVDGGSVPEGYQANELGLLLNVTADTQSLATRIAKVFNPYLLHFPTQLGTPLPSYAFPFSPAETERGQVFSFKLHHVIELEDPLALVRLASGNGEEGKQ